jgi:hypothetical protein
MTEQLDDADDIVRENYFYKEKVFRKKIEEPFNEWRKDSANQDGLTEGIAQQ